MERIIRVIAVLSAIACVLFLAAWIASFVVFVDVYIADRESETQQQFGFAFGYLHLVDTYWVDGMTAYAPPFSIDRNPVPWQANVQRITECLLPFGHGDDASWARKTWTREIGPRRDVGSSFGLIPMSVANAVIPIGYFSYCRRRRNRRWRQEQAVETSTDA